MTLPSEPTHIILQSPASNDPLLDLNTQPSLDLQFATGKTLDDRVSGFPLVNHQRDASSGKSAGTYVGSDGLIKTSVVNLAKYSEDLSQWGGSGNVNSNSYIAPNGTLTADELTSLTRYLTPEVPGGGGTYRVSFWLKASGTPGTVDVTLSGGNTLNIGTYTFTATSEWVRVEQEVRLGAAAPNFGLTFVYVSTPVLIWGLQAEIGSTATTYIPTTTTASGAPRFDHDPVTGESLGLLIEESRTNLFQYSTDFSQGFAKTNSTLTANTTTAPDGTTTASTLTVSTGSSYSYMLVGISTANGTSYSLSYWVKYNNCQYVWLLGAEQPDVFAYFDLINGVVGAANGYNCSITSYPDGWYRITATRTKTGATAFEEIGIGITRSSTSPSDNQAGDAVYLWGAQFEANASFPTSYIPTSGSTVTRAADVASITGSNFSSWYNQSEGTVFVDFQTYGTSTQQIIALTAGSSNSTRWGIWNNQLYIAQSGSQYFSSLTPSTSPTKTAFAVASNDAIGASNGSLTAQDTTVILPTPDNASIGRTAGSQDLLNGHISRLAYYPYRLADATSQEITS